MTAMPPRLVVALSLCVVGCGPSSGSDTGDEGSSGTATSSTLSSSTDAPTSSAADTGTSGTTGDASCVALAPDFASSPSSTRDGAFVTSVGPGPRFEVPGAWLEWQTDFANNLHLSRPELEAVRVGAGEWDTEYAEVLAEVLDFDRCSAHVGGEGWGADAVSFGDLQLRVYVLEEAPGDVLERLGDTLMGAHVKDITVEMTQPWARAVLHWDNFYSDYGGPALVDLRLRRFEAATVVLAGMYSGDAQGSNAELDAVVASTCWSSGTDECCASE